MAGFGPQDHGELLMLTYGKLTSERVDDLLAKFRDEGYLEDVSCEEFDAWLLSQGVNPEAYWQAFLEQPLYVPG